MKDLLFNKNEFHLTSKRRIIIKEILNEEARPYISQKQLEKAVSTCTCAFSNGMQLEIN